MGYMSKTNYFPDYEVRSRLPLQIMTRIFWMHIQLELVLLDNKKELIISFFNVDLSTLF